MLYHMMWPIVGFESNEIWLEKRQDKGLCAVDLKISGELEKVPAKWISTRASPWQPLKYKCYRHESAMVHEGD